MRSHLDAVVVFFSMWAKILHGSVFIPTNVFKVSDKSVSFHTSTSNMSLLLCYSRLTRKHKATHTFKNKRDCFFSDGRVSLLDVLVVKTSCQTVLRDTCGVVFLGQCVWTTVRFVALECDWDKYIEVCVDMNDHIVQNTEQCVRFPTIYVNPHQNSATHPHPNLNPDPKPDPNNQSYPWPDP